MLNNNNRSPREVFVIDCGGAQRKAKPSPRLPLFCGYTDVMLRLMIKAADAELRAVDHW